MKDEVMQSLQEEIKDLVDTRVREIDESKGETVILLYLMCRSQEETLLKKQNWQMRKL